MQCKEAREQLLLSWERDLTGDEYPDIHGHLDECAECRRFASAMRHWSGTSSGAATDGLGIVATQPAMSSDLTERVLASVRPLPPPWVYHDGRRERRRVHLIGFIFGALAVTLTFIAVSLALVVVFASKGAVGIASPSTMEAIVGDDVQRWFVSLPADPAHGAITVGALALFAVLLLRWSHALALRVGHDRHA